MKKIASLIILLVLTASLVACVDSTGSGTDKTPSLGDGAGTSSGNEVSLAETVLIEQDNVKITATGFDNDGFFGSGVKVLIENNSAQNLTFQVRDSSINGAMVDTLFSEDVVARKKANATITFVSADLKTAGIETIKDIEFKIIALDTESYDTVFESQVIELKTSADSAFVQTFDDSGEILYNEGGIKVVAKKLSSEDSFWGSELYLYVENKSEKNLTVQTRDVSINGFMVDPVFSCDILSQKVAYSSITFMESDLTDNGITDITELELNLVFLDAKTFDTVKESDVIKVSFNG